MEAPPLAMLPRPRRSAVAAAVRRGEVVLDPSEAYAAVQYAQRLGQFAHGRLRRRSLLFHLTVAALCLGPLVAALASGRHATAVTGLLLLGAVVPPAVALAAVQLRAAAGSAERLNRQLLEAHRLPEPP